MVDDKQYVSFNPQLNMSSKYLTETVAFFLAGIISSEEEISVEGKNYKVSPVRYNYGTATELEIAEHYELIKNLSASVNGYTVMAENIRGTNLDSGKNRLPGFCTYFENRRGIEIRDILPDLEAALLESPQTVKQAFISGIYDGRGSSDINKINFQVRQIAIDVISLDIGEFLSRIIQSNGFYINFNTHRERKEGGKRRNYQLRIKDVATFAKEIGLISPRRISLLSNAFSYNYSNVSIINESSGLPGLKTIRRGE